MGNENQDFDAVIDSMIEESTEPDVTETVETTRQTEPAQDTPQSDSTGDTTQTQQTEGTEGEHTTATPNTFKVKFRHEEKELTLEEMTALAQKGMLYDAEDMSTNLSALREIAKGNGYNSVKDYLEAVKQATLNNQAQQLVNDKSIPQDIAKEFVENKLKISEFENLEKSRREQEERQRKAVEEITDFQNKYPGVDCKNLPQEMLISKSRNPDVPLSFHYAAYREKMLATEAAAREKQEENAASSTPSLRDNTTDTFNEEDALLKEVFDD